MSDFTRIQKIQERIAMVRALGDDKIDAAERTKALAILDAKLQEAMGPSGMSVDPLEGGMSVAPPAQAGGMTYGAMSSPENPDPLEGGMSVESMALDPRVEAPKKARLRTEFTPKQDRFSALYEAAATAPLEQEGLYDGKSASGEAQFYTPPKSDWEARALPRSTMDVLWFEPDVREVREYLRPYMGEAADTVSEGSQEYTRVADYLYMRAYERAAAKGEPIVRAKYSEHPDLFGRLGAAAALNEGFREGITGGLSKLTDRALRQVPGNLTAEGAAKAHPGWRGAGELLGMVSPFGALNMGYKAIQKAMLPKLAAAGLERLPAKVLSGMGAGSATAVGVGTVGDVASMDEMRAPTAEEVASWGGKTALRSSLGALGGGGGELLAAGLGAGARALLARPTASMDALRSAQPLGYELSALGKARPPPIEKTLAMEAIEAGVAGKNVPSRAVLAQQRAMRDVPERDTLIEDIMRATELGQGFPAADKLAEKAAPIVVKHAAIADAADKQYVRSLEGLVESGAPARPTSIFENLWKHASEREGRWPSIVDKKPMELLAGFSDVTFSVKPQGNHLQRLRMELQNQGVTPITTDVGTLLRRAENAGTAAAERWRTLLEASTPKWIKDNMRGIAQAHKDPGKGHDKALKYWMKMRVVVAPRELTAKQFDSVIGSSVDKVTKAASKAADLDPALQDLQLAMYRDRNRFAVDIPEDMRALLPDDPVVMDPATGTGEPLEGLGLLKKLQETRLAEGAWRNRSLGLPEELPTRGPVSPDTYIDEALPRLSFDQERAVARQLEKYTPEAASSKAYQKVADEFPEIEPILETIGTRNKVGEPVAALKRAGLEGEGLATDAMEKLLDGNVPLLEKLAKVKALNRAGGDRAAIAANLRGENGLYALDKLNALEDILRPEELRLLRVTMAGDNLRSVTANPELYARTTGGVPTIGTNFMGTRLSRAGDMLYPLARSLGADPGSLPRPGVWQARPSYSALEGQARSLGLGVPVVEAMLPMVGVAREATRARKLRKLLLEAEKAQKEEEKKMKAEQKEEERFRRLEEAMRRRAGDEEIE